MEKRMEFLTKKEAEEFLKKCNWRKYKGSEWWPNYTYICRNGEFSAPSIVIRKVRNKAAYYLKKEYAAVQNPNRVLTTYECEEMKNAAEADRLGVPY